MRCNRGFYDHGTFEPNTQTGVVCCPKKQRELELAGLEPASPISKLRDERSNQLSNGPGEVQRRIVRLYGTAASPTITGETGTWEVCVVNQI